MDCFICKKNLSINYISKHFRLVHNLTESDTYICTFKKNCNQMLSSFSALNRHFKCHLNKELLLDTTTCSIMPQSSAASSSSISLNSSKNYQLAINDNNVSNEKTSDIQHNTSTVIQNTSSTMSLNSISNEYQLITNDKNLRNDNVTDIQSETCTGIQNILTRSFEDSSAAFSGKLFF